MDASSQIQPARRLDGLAGASFVLGLTTLIFPIISVAFLIAVKGGPGYVQNLLCGVPVAALSILTAIASLSRRARYNRAGIWMAMSGLVLSALFFAIAFILGYVLLLPYLSGTVH
jgi:hypothetical protein